MKIQHDIPTYSICWLANTYDKATATGRIAHYYLPESMTELQELCRSLSGAGIAYHVIGHTSNLYFRPDTSLAHVVSTRLLTEWTEGEDRVNCDCGVSVKTLAKRMVEAGVEGFSGLVDLPGTVGASIYGNATVGPYSINALLVSVTLLLPDGRIRDFAPEDLKLEYRSSALKRGELKGTILRCRLRRVKGDADRIQATAAYYHQWRVANQPGPSRNLGTTSLLSAPNLYGRLLRACAKVMCLLARPADPVAYKTHLLLRLAGYSRLVPYLQGVNRYMWMDSLAHHHFDGYVDFLHKLFKRPKLEIEIW